MLPIGDREALLRDEPAEGDVGHARCQDRRVQDAREVVGREVQLGKGHQCDHRDGCGTKPVPTAAARQQHEAHREQGDGQGRDRPGRERVGVHVNQDWHLGTRELHGQQPNHQPVRDHQGRHEDQQMPEAPVPQQDQGGGPAQRHDGRERREQGGGFGDLVQCRRAGPGEPGKHRLVGRLDQVGRADEDVHCGTEDQDREKGPDPSRPTVLPHQRRGLARRTAPHRAATAARVGDVDDAPRRRARSRCHAASSGCAANGALPRQTLRPRPMAVKVIRTEGGPCSAPACVTCWASRWRSSRDRSGFRGDSRWTSRPRCAPPAG
jgi:hypothetical protein